MKLRGSLVLAHTNTTTRSIGSFEAVRLEVVRLVPPLNINMAHIVREMSPCVLNAAGGASDTPVATPCEPYRVKDIQKSRFLRARALSKMALTEPFNT